MPTDSKRHLRVAVRSAQDRYESAVDSAREGRRQAFAEAQKEGLTVREIAEVVGLHHSRVSQIIRGE